MENTVLGSKRSFSGVEGIDGREGVGLSPPALEQVRLCEATDDEAGDIGAE